MKDVQHVGEFCGCGKLTKQQKREAWEDIKMNHPDIREQIEQAKDAFGDIELGYYYSETLGDSSVD